MKPRRISRRRVLGAGGLLALGTAGAIVGCASLRSPPKRQVRIFDVRDYGAAGDGTTLDTAAFQKAIDEAAASGERAQVLVRGGKQYLVGGIMLKGGIDFHLADDARVLISTRREDYGISAVPRVAASQPTTNPRNDRSVFNARAANGLTISGTGTIDGRWKEFMDRFDEENEWWRPKPFRPPLFQLAGCKDLNISGITITGSSVWTVHLVGCQHVLVDRVKIDNQLDVPNCDGVNPDHSQDVEISNCHIKCGDDAIAVKTTRAGMEYGPTHNIRVHDCIMETQDSGVKIGTETTQDIYDVIFERIKIRTSCRGLTIQLRDSGNVHNIVFRNIEFVSRYYSNPWWGRGEAISFTALPRTAQTQLGKIHDVLVQNVTGRAENSVRVNGHPTSRVRDVTLENVSITLDRWTKYPGGVFDNRPPEQGSIETHGNPGYHIRHADNVTLKRCKLAWGSNRPDYFTNAIEGEDVTNLQYPDFTGEAAHPQRDKAINIH